MARLSVNFDEPSLKGSYEGYNPNDIFSALPEEYSDANKPLIIHLTSNLPEDMIESAVVQRTVLADEKVALGTKMFSIIQMDGTKVTKEHPYAKILGGKELPRMVVVYPDGKKVGSVEGKISPSKIFSLMKRATKKTYKTNVESFIKDYQRVLTDIDRVEALKSALATRIAASGNISKSKQREYAKKEAEYAKMEEEVLTREQKLLEFRRRESKATSS